MLSNIMEYISVHWHALAIGAVVTGSLAWLAKKLDTSGGAFVVKELEKLRVKANENSILSQLACDDALINILEDSIPLVLSELDDETQKALAAGSIEAVDWTAFGKNLYAIVKDNVEGGINNYLTNSSHADGQVLASLIAKRFFITQKMSAKGLIVDNARAEVTDVTKVTVQTISKPIGLPPSTTVVQEVHTDIKPNA